jgi:hypothetical protein
MPGWNFGSFGFAPKSWNKQGNEFFFGSQSKMKPYNKGGLSALEQMLQGGGLEGNELFGAGSDFLQNLLSGSPGATSAFEAPFMQQFQQQIAPGIAERFAGMGTGGGASSSSALNNSLAQAGGNLQNQLAQLRSGLQMQALPQALQYANQPNQNRMNAAGMIPGQYFEMPGQGGLLQGLLQAFAQGAGGSFGGGF